MKLTKRSRGRYRSFDHILAWSAGGEHTLENLRLICLDCNVQRQAKTDEEWLRWSKKLIFPETRTGHKEALETQRDTGELLTTVDT